MLASVLQAASPHQACSGIFATFAHDTKFSMLRPASATPWLTYRQTRRSTGAKPLNFHQFTRGQRTGLTFDGDSACFMSSALYSTLGLGSLEMTYVGDARCPCE